MRQPRKLAGWGGNSVFNLNLCICRLKIYRFRVQICIFSLKIEFLGDSADLMSCGAAMVAGRGREDVLGVASLIYYLSGKGNDCKNCWL